MSGLHDTCLTDTTKEPFQPSLVFYSVKWFRMKTFSTLYHKLTKYILNRSKTCRSNDYTKKILSVATVMEGVAVEHSFEREPSMDSSMKVW
jgi:hypothetical protein